MVGGAGGDEENRADGLFGTTLAGLAASEGAADEVDDMGERYAQQSESPSSLGAKARCKPRRQGDLKGDYVGDEGDCRPRRVAQARRAATGEEGLKTSMLGIRKRE